MFRPEPLDMVTIVVVALMFFGTQRLPETAPAFGKALREFRDAVANADDSSDSQEPHDRTS